MIISRFFREAKSSVIKAHGGAVRTVAFSNDGRCLLTGSDDKTIKVLLTYSFSLILNIFLGLLHSNITTRCNNLYYFDNSIMELVSLLRSGQVWLVQGQKFCATLTGHINWVRSAEFHPDGGLASDSALNGVSAHFVFCFPCILSILFSVFVRLQRDICLHVILR